ncbi:hypothetical protein MX629_11280 [Carnobacterium divergens]|uniref:Cyclic nucleotide-binding domain-containing protein n=1 Tax=Carnobacterium divergens TaxID=2748 RepID=A0AAW8RER3_CARDV|nr:hypothetical protein [Carnobacterium divergens]MDT1959011.1 hypothetical protein [Carnobacterium divergens]MDT1974979.1 hypothetical protein [Carnobacterium divergens]
MRERESINQAIIINELIANKYVDELVKLKNYKKGVEIDLTNDKYIGFLNSGAIGESIYGIYILKFKKEFLNLLMLFSKYNEKKKTTIITITDTEIIWVKKSYFRDFLSVNPLFMELLIREISITYHRLIEELIEDSKNSDYLKCVEKVLKDIFHNLDISLEISLVNLFEACRIPVNERENIINALRGNKTIKVNPNGCGKVNLFKDITIG